MYFNYLYVMLIVFFILHTISIFMLVLPGTGNATYKYRKGVMMLLILAFWIISVINYSLNNLQTKGVRITEDAL